RSPGMSGSGRLALRAETGTDEASGRDGRRAAGTGAGVKSWLSSSLAEDSMISIVLVTGRVTRSYFGADRNGEVSNDLPGQPIPQTIVVDEPEGVRERSRDFAKVLFSITPRACGFSKSYTGAGFIFD